MEKENIKKFELRHYDTTLLTFTAFNNKGNIEVQIKDISKENKELFPIGMDVTNEGLSAWLEERVIPENRTNAEELLQSCNLSFENKVDIISVSKALSLNDSYWIVEENFRGIYDYFNLYENYINRKLSLIALKGYGDNTLYSIYSSPEFTTNGMLPKCWRRQNGKLYLYKGGTTGYSNAGCEPYSEYLAFQIAKVLEINAVEYDLSMWNNVLCSTCPLLTNKDISFVPIGKIVKKGGIKAVENYYKTLGSDFEKALSDMIVFDAIIANTDRHYGNFGVLVYNKTNKIIFPSPLFDHGCSLFSYAGEENFVTNEMLEKYISENVYPKVYDDFIEKAKEHLDDELREKIKKLFNFKFKRHSRYNLNDNRLKIIEYQIHKRAKMILM